MIKKEEDIFLNYINDYIVFLEEMIAVQKRQLDAVVGTSVKDTEKIKEVDKTVVELQSYTKRMDVMEQKRMEVHNQVGYGDMKFDDIINSLDGVKKQNYQKTFDKFKSCIDSIGFYSQKIHEKVQSDLATYNRIINQPSSYNSNKQQLEVNRFAGSLQIKT